MNRRDDHHNTHLNNMSKEPIKLEPRLLYDQAIVGYTEGGRAVYREDKIIHLLEDEDGMTYEEAVEWHNYNTRGTFDNSKDPNRPLFISPINLSIREII